MTDEKNHNVNDLIAKHLGALFDEADAGNYCDQCLLECLIASGIGSVLLRTSSLRDTQLVVAECLRLAIDASISGQQVLHPFDSQATPKNKMN